MGETSSNAIGIRTFQMSYASCQKKFHPETLLSRSLWVPSGKVGFFCLNFVNAWSLENFASTTVFPGTLSRAKLNALSHMSSIGAQSTVQARDFAFGDMSEIEKSRQEMEKLCSFSIHNSQS